MAHCLLTPVPSMKRNDKRGEKLVKWISEVRSKMFSRAGTNKSILVIHILGFLAATGNRIPKHA